MGLQRVSRSYRVLPCLEELTFLVYFNELPWYCALPFFNAFSYNMLPFTVVCRVLTRFFSALTRFFSALRHSTIFCLVPRCRVAALDAFI